MTRKFICVLVVYCLILCGCSEKKSTGDLSKSINKPGITTANPKEDTVEMSESTDQPNITTENPNEYTMEMYIKERESTGYTDFGSNAYWSNVIKEKKAEIDYIVNWFKNINYCEALSFSSNGDADTLPDNKKTRKKIQNEKNFDKIKELISINEYDIRNNWLKDNEIIILHRFELEGMMGNYCLVYVGSEPKKLDKAYRKIDDNYYSDVIFYE